MTIKWNVVIWTQAAVKDNMKAFESVYGMKLLKDTSLKILNCYVQKRSKWLEIVIAHFDLSEMWIWWNVKLVVNEIKECNLYELETYQNDHWDYECHVYDYVTIRMIVKVETIGNDMICLCNYQYDHESWDYWHW